MHVSNTELPDLLIVHIDVHRDRRGFFAETWRNEWLSKLKSKHALIQDNHARSEERGVVRGLHFQKPPSEQGKLIWATRGAIFDVAVDLRVGSPTYGRWCGQLLSADNGLRFFVPRGFAHGYMTLEPQTEVQYKADGYYDPSAEGGLRWDDPALGIQWPDIPAFLSEKDARLPSIDSLQSPFVYRNKR